MEGENFAFFTLGLVKIVFGEFEVIFTFMEQEGA